ncbi:MAG: hypothetical protein UFA98_03605, partial [Ruminococcus sp.]|nr:hypothetical protein [Ruminococcus sp.]
VCGLRSKIFRQVVQINQGKADALPRFFWQADGIRFKQAVRLDLCGVALIIIILKTQCKNLEENVYEKNNAFSDSCGYGFGSCSLFESSKR